MANLTFKYQKWRERKAQTFDKENIKITKAGKTYNVYQAIQEAREDTEIMPTLKKYGCIEGHMTVDAGKMFDDFTKYNDLRGVLEQKKQAEQMFYSLPADIRNSFNNDINQFTKNGKEWLNNRIAEKDKRFINVKPITENNTNMASTGNTGISVDNVNNNTEVK